MATIKSFSDLQQSRKLAEILPLESADMYYPWDIDSKSFLNIPIVKDDSYYVQGSIPCWSLASLLGVLPEPYQLTSNKEGKVQLMLIHHLEKDYYDDSVDACYEMIIKLHELNLL